VINLLVHHKVLADYKDASWADIAWYLKQGMRCLVNWEDVLSDHVIETQVHLVKGEGLLKVTSVYGTEVLIQVAIVDFKASELRVFDADINTDHS